MHVVGPSTPAAADIRQVVGVELSDEEAQALAAVDASLARNVAAFPAADLKQVEPPLRSVPGPHA